MGRRGRLLFGTTGALAMVGLVVAALEWHYAGGWLVVTMVGCAALFPLLAALSGWDRPRQPAVIGLLVLGCACTGIAATESYGSAGFILPSWQLSAANLLSMWWNALPLLTALLGILAIGLAAARLTRRASLVTVALALASVCLGISAMWSLGSQAYLLGSYSGRFEILQWLPGLVVGMAAVATLCLALGWGREHPRPVGTAEAEEPAKPELGRGDRPILVSLVTIGALVVAGGVAGGIWYKTHRQPSIELTEVFPDPGLRACILTQEKWSEQVSPDDLESVTTLDCSTDRTAPLTVADLTGIDRLPNLYRLDLGGQGLTSIAALASLDLKSLKITDNAIEDLSPLASMTSLYDLGASGNAITDITPLRSLTSLGALGLARNHLEDISTLSSLPQLSLLDLSENGVRDLAPLGSLTMLVTLDVSGNSFDDLTSLGSLPQLNRLVAAGDHITDPAPLCQAPSLQHLDLRDNEIADASRLAGCTAVAELWLGDNPLTSLAPLAALPNLVGVDMQSFTSEPTHEGVEELRAEGVYVGGYAK